MLLQVYDTPALISDKIPELSEFCNCNECTQMDSKEECKCCNSSEFIRKELRGTTYNTRYFVRN